MVAALSVAVAVVGHALVGGGGVPLGVVPPLVAVAGVCWLLGEYLAGEPLLTGLVLAGVQLFVHVALDSVTMHHGMSIGSSLMMTATHLGALLVGVLAIGQRAPLGPSGTAGVRRPAPGAAGPASAPTRFDRERHLLLVDLDRIPTRHECLRARASRRTSNCSCLSRPIAPDYSYALKGSLMPKKFVLRAAAIVAASALVVIGAAGSASAHVTVSSPDAKPGGYAKLVFRVPTESDNASTTKLVVSLPKDHPFAHVGAQVKDGWKVEKTKEKLPRRSRSVTSR